jgi:hypothetical protein
MDRTHLGDLTLRAELHLGLDRLDHITFNYRSLVPAGEKK